ncbi:uncharacterized protein BJX67DRAFT_167866 [Aspergillus lucknowensis]|uniref:non-specific serine/threonine protein kinase n=1 Tax=Aspergillus lucknowensis TaxID=176173 RepID=A0ABR4M593_9EURO
MTQASLPRSPTPSFINLSSIVATTKFSFNFRRLAILDGSRPPTVTTRHRISFSHLIRPACGRNIATTQRRTDSINDSWTPVEYMPHESVDQPYGYRPGGYHPVSIGDCLSDRYDVVHKLGFGSYSTTWLARDTIMMKYVAIKIAIADAEKSESQLLNTLAPSEPRDKGTPWRRSDLSSVRYISP